MRRHDVLCVALLVALTLTGCVSTDRISPPDQRAASDPWEPWNRNVDAFNTTVDNATLKPLARGYRKVVPGFMRRGVSNFFDNLATPANSLNNFLQGKGKAGFSELGRFALNSTVGIGGLFDVGTAAGIEAREEDFGQTFAVWGMGDGPYFVLPFLGPSTVRDTLALPFDFASNPLTWYDNTSARDKLRGLQVLDLRTRLLSAEKLLEDSSDPYITLRESYLQNREYKIHDGNPPLDDDFYDDFEDFEDDDAAPEDR